MCWRALLSAPEKAAQALQDQVLRAWMMGDPSLWSNWQGDPLDIVNMGENFDRTDLGNNYAGSFSNTNASVGDQVALKKHALAAEKDFWGASSLQDGLSRLKGGDDNAFRGIAHDGLQSLEHHERNKGRLTENIDLHDWIASHLQRRVDRINSDLNSGMSVLASVGSTAPFVGLFGTVWGIMNSFINISKSQTTNLAVVAPGIAEALLATAMGLVAAIPAVIIYNHFARGTRTYLELVGRASGAAARLL